MTNPNFNLRDAFPEMPEDCRSALSTAARSVKEEKHMKRKYPVAVLVAAILILMTTIAIADGWNVLSFLGIQPDSDAQTLVQPVSASASTGNVTLTIDSAITDGEYLVFDYTVSNADPSKPVYLNVEEFSVGGSPNIDFVLDKATFDDHWLPGMSSPATLTGGCIVSIAQWLADSRDDTLRVDLTVGVHTAAKPVLMLDSRRTEEAIATINDGYLVIVGNESFVEPQPPGSISEIAYYTGLSGMDRSVYGTERTTMTLSFSLDMKAARASLQMPELPYPAYSEDVKLELEHFTVSPLQIRVTAVATWADDAPAGLTGKFVLRDKEGNTIKVKNVSASPETYTKTLGRDNRFTNKQTVWECAIIAPTSALPDEADLVFRLTDGSEAVLPLKFR